MKDEKSIAAQDLTPADLAHRQKLKKRLTAYLIVGLLGLLAAMLQPIALSLGRWDTVPTPEVLEKSRELQRRLSFFGGVGSGLAVSCLLLAIRTWRAMENPELLRKSRIESNDERTAEITVKSRSAAGYSLLIVIYIGCIIGGIFYSVLHTVLAVSACVYLASYCLAYWIFNKRM